MAPIRGVWIPGPDHTRFYESPSEMALQLAEFQKAGINTVFIAVYGAGRTIYPSPAMQRLTGVAIDERFAGRNPLAEAVAAARGTGIAVVAWFEFGFASYYQGGRGAELARLRPAWVALGQDGKPVEKNGFRWLNALDPQVQHFLSALMLEAAKTEGVYGVQGDDRLPALPSEAGYNPAVIAQYQAEHGGALPPANHRDAQWVQWRADLLSAYMQRLHTTLKAANPQIHISMSPSAYPWSKTEYLQDWPAWLRNGWVDSVSPQLYRRDLDSYERELRKLTREQVCAAQLQQVSPGLLMGLGRGGPGSYLATPKLVQGMVQANRDEGVTGEVFFFSEGVRQRADVLAAIYRQ